MLAKAETGQEIVLDRFAGYHGGLPKGSATGAKPVQRLVFRVIPEKIDQIAMLKRGEVDLVAGVPAKMVGILVETPGIHLVSRPATRSYFAEINCLKPPFDNPWIRRALNYAVDMKGLVKNVLDGYGVVLPTVMLPNAFGFNDQIAMVPV